jgi:DNA-binding response OmpR family regulator
MTETILLIDDEPDLLALLEVRLKASGYDVLKASSGEKGLEKVRENRVCAILLDIMMPGMDGFEALQRLKADPKTRGIPVIMVSAKAHQEDLKKARELGAVDYVPKPMDGRLLVEILRKVIVR